MSTTSGFSILTLQTVNSAFNADLNYSSVTFGPLTIPLVSFLWNPNYSGLNNVTENQLNATYNGIIDKLKLFITNVSNNSIPGYNFGTINLFRILVTLADGNVFFDSSKNNNTYTNFLSKSINENHGTRHYI